MYLYVYNMYLLLIRVYTVHNILRIYNNIYIYTYRSCSAPFPTPPRRVYIINNVKVSPFDGVCVYGVMRAVYVLGRRTDE